MAVTVHWCAETPDHDLVIRSELAAFRYIRGSHHGAILGEHFMSILDSLGPSVAQKVCLKYLVLLDKIDCSH